MPIRRRCAVVGLALAAWIAALPSCALAQTATPAQGEIPSAPAPESTPAPQAQGQAQAAQPSPLARLESLRLQLDQIEVSIRRERTNDDSLFGLRDNLDTLRDDLRAEIAALELRVAEADLRVRQLGPAPAEGTQPEAATLAVERARLTARHAELDAALKQARVSALHADELAERITERRRALFAHDLFTRSGSAFDLSLAHQTFAALPGGLRAIATIGGSWATSAMEAGAGRIAGAVLTLLVIIALAAALLRWLGRTRAAVIAAGTRFSRAQAAILTLLRIAITAPAGAVALILVLDGFGLLPPAIMEIGLGFVVAVGVASFSRGVATGLFAPAEPERRLPRLSDATARLLATHLAWSGRVLALFVFINVMQRATVAPHAVMVAASMLLAEILLLILLHLLVRLAQGGHEADSGARGQWLRGAGWIVAGVIGLALATGYIAFAAFATGRLVMLLAVAGALYIALVFTDSLFSEVLTGDTPRTRSVAAFFGIKTRSIELFGTLLSAVIRTLLVLAVILPLLDPLGVLRGDFLNIARSLIYGFHIGNLNISPGKIAGALIVFLVVAAATRAAQRWLQARLLPRTALDPGLQNSVATIFGYSGFALAAALSLAQAGIDLQNFTLIAGALSIGIGFGMQSVVSNFVSGLILLTERPIRVGDMIVVKGEEGFVRKIRVRATEIETFERASVIVPNSELITGVVKNWTHSNTLGRIIVKVPVSLDSDPEKVCGILQSILNSHRQVLQSPEPKAMIAAIGDGAIAFELIGVVGNVAQAGGVKSELCFEILRRFREAGIAIAQPREFVMRNMAGASPS